MRWPSKDFRDYLDEQPVRSRTPVIQAPRAARGTPPVPEFGIGFASEALADQAAGELRESGYAVEIRSGGTLARQPWHLVANGHPEGLDPAAADRLFGGWALERGGHFLWFDTPPGGLHG